PASVWDDTHWSARSIPELPHTSPVLLRSPARIRGIRCRHTSARALLQCPRCSLSCPSGNLWVRGKWCPFPYHALPLQRNSVYGCCLSQRSGQRFSLSSDPPGCPVSFSLSHPQPDRPDM